MLQKLKKSAWAVIGATALPFFASSAYAEGWSVPDPRGSGNVHWRSLARYHNPGTFYDTRDLYFGVGRVWSGTQYLGLIGAFQQGTGAQDFTWGLGLGSGFLGSTSASNPRVLRDSTNGTRIFDFAYANTTGNGYDNLCTAIVDVTSDAAMIAACRGMKTGGLYEVYLVKFNRYGLVTAFGTDGIKATGWQTASNHAFVRGMVLQQAVGSEVLLVGAVGSYISNNFQPKIESFNSTTGASSVVYTNPSCTVPTQWSAAMSSNATATSVAFDGTNRYYIAISEWKYDASGNRKSYAWKLALNNTSNCAEMAPMSHPFMSTETNFATTFNDTLVTSVITENYTGLRKAHFAGAARIHTMAPDTAGPFHCGVFHTNSNVGYIGTGAGATDNWGFVQMPGYAPATYDGHSISLFNADLSADGPKYDCILNDVVAKDLTATSKTSLFVAGAAYSLGATARPPDGSITYPQHTVITGNYDFLSAKLTDNASSLAKVAVASEGPGDDVINKIVPWFENTTNSEMVGIGRTANTQYFAGGMLTFVDETTDWNVNSTTSEPSGRINHSQIWTGQKMVVWGGNNATVALADGGIYDPIADTWGAVETGSAPTARTRHGTTWDGTQMIVFGGDNNSGTYYSAAYKLAFSSSDTNGAWTALNSATNTRSNHVQVWGKTAAGAATLVAWGGWNGAAVTTGEKYAIATNAWSNINATGAPTAATGAIGVWDPPNNRALIYGGSTDNANAGATTSLRAYTPGTDAWATLTSSTTGRWKGVGAYANRYFTIFGGVNTAGTRLASAERFNIALNTWTTANVTNQPTAREGSVGIFNGAEFLVFGGYDGTTRLNTGSVYNPKEDAWTLSSTTGGATGREYAKGVWTGERMIVWGGYDGTTYLGAGYQYAPGQVFTHTGRAAWSATDIADVDLPAARFRHSVIWTGKEMIVWGGLDSAGTALQTGGRYDPVANNWATLDNADADRPSIRKYHTAVWTGTRMIVWGGSDNTAEGGDGTELNTGGIYNPLEPGGTANWTAVNTTLAPTVRDMHGAVWAYSGTNTATWTGKMVIWGGNDDGPSAQPNKSDGKYYVPDYGNPEAGTWTALGATGKLTDGRFGHAMWFDGKNVGIWGGNNGTLGTPANVATGAMLDLGVNTTWTAMSTTSAPSARTTTALWTGKYVVLFGENSKSTASTPFCTGTGATAAERGYRFDPFTGSLGTWSGVSVTDIPSCTNMPAMAWTGSKVMVWGGRTSAGSFLSTGSLYDPIYNTWTAISNTTAPTGRADASAVFDGKNLIVWGGSTDGAATGVLNTGSRYQR